MPPLIVPTVVREEETMEEPSVVELKTLVPLILYSLPLARLKCSLEVQASVESTQVKVLLVLPSSVMPPPSAPASEGLSTLPSSKFLSLISTVVLFTKVVVQKP